MLANSSTISTTQSHNFHSPPEDCADGIGDFGSERGPGAAGASGGLDAPPVAAAALAASLAAFSRWSSRYFSITIHHIASQVTARIW